MALPVHRDVSVRHALLGRNVTFPEIVSPARYTGDGIMMSMTVAPSPQTRCIGSSTASTSAVAMTTANPPSVSTSRPPRSATSRQAHLASTGEDLGAHDGTVNDAEVPVNSLAALGNRCRPAQW
ncbi:hypothetical protein [Mycobacterium sp. URHB0021]